MSTTAVPRAPGRGAEDLRYLPLRERKRERTRRHVEQVALALFAERGYDHVSVAEVAEEAEVAVRSFFRYFPTKEDVLLGDVREQLDRLPGLLLQAGDHHADDVVGAVGAALLEMCDVDEAERRLMMARHEIVLRTPTLIGAVLGVVTEGERAVARFAAERAGCDLDSDLYPWLVATTSMAAQLAASTRWVASGAVGSPLPMVEAALAQVAGGLRVHHVPHVPVPVAAVAVPPPS